MLHNAHFGLFRVCEGGKPDSVVGTIHEASQLQNGPSCRPQRRSLHLSRSLSFGRNCFTISEFYRDDDKMTSTALERKSIYSANCFYGWPAIFRQGIGIRRDMLCLPIPFDL